MTTDEVPLSAIVREIGLMAKRAVIGIVAILVFFAVVAIFMHVVIFTAEFLLRNAVVVVRWLGGYAPPAWVHTVIDAVSILMLVGFSVLVVWEVIDRAKHRAAARLESGECDE